MRFENFGVATAVCVPELALAGASLGACAELGAGLLQVEASGFVHDGSSERGWLELGPTGTVRAELAGPLYVRLLARAAARLSRPRLAYTRADGTRADVFSMPAFGFGAELGLGVELL